MVQLDATFGQELLESLQVLFEEISEGQHDPGWHTNIGGVGGPELTIAVELAELELPTETSR